jgi:hypothetical protein
MEYKDVDLFYLAQDTDQRRAIVNKVLRGGIQNIPAAIYTAVVVARSTGRW